MLIIVKDVTILNKIRYFVKSIPELLNLFG